MEGVEDWDGTFTIVVSAKWTVVTMIIYTSYCMRYLPNLGYYSRFMSWGIVRYQMHGYQQREKGERCLRVPGAETHLSLGIHLFPTLCKNHPLSQFPIFPYFPIFPLPFPPNTKSFLNQMAFPLT